MSLDITQFHATFFEESFEGLQTMESGLLNMDVGNVDMESINAIFRAAHSIKGGSATFGFSEVASFTHIMETLLDRVRDHKILVTQDIIDVLLRSVDCLRDLLTSSKEKTPANIVAVADVQSLLEAMLGNKQQHKQAATTRGAQRGLAHWTIIFSPNSNILQTGNDPQRIFRELDKIGTTKITPDLTAVPDLETIDPELCYIRWNITIETEADEKTLREPFDWVLDDCTLSMQCLNDINEGNVGKSNPIATDARPSSTTSAAATSTIPANSTLQGSKKITTDAGSIRVSIDKIDALINMVGELVITQSMMGQINGSIDELDSDKLEKLKDGLGLLERNTRELQESVMRIRMLPISSVFNRFPRMVHDLSNQLKKKIELKIVGEQTELDKTVLEKIGDPLVHLVRNSIDHGIETPDKRMEAGKSESGTIKLNAFHKGGNIIIEISDDGAGFKKDRILKKAMEKGLISTSEELTDDKIYELIFMAGFSTAETVSDVSGRGVGMDVVKRNIRELGGNIDVKSEEGKGTTFTIRMPLTLAILDGQLISIGRETYILPLVSIVESLQVNPSCVNAISGRYEVYKLRNNYIPIIRLYKCLDVSNANTDLTKSLLVVVEGAGQQVALMVDDLLGQQQVVIKSLESNFKKIDGISGATILGDGTVALIIDVDGLVCLSKATIEQHSTNDPSQQVAA